MHYWAGSSQEWAGVTAQMSGEYRCVALDLPGFGVSSPPDLRWGVEEYANAVEALLATLRIDRYLLVGHSMGGKIALSLAMRQPTGLLGLALIAPSPPTPEPMQEAERQNLLATHDNRAQAEKLLPVLARIRFPRRFSRSASRTTFARRKPHGIHGSNSAASRTFPPT